ncbi:hypothetical protein F5Y01DRAFT_302403 [Xylaria sp. FL0043]|nr:hypothetical protein F5Y01DRAFT_302403 [Xylaria sp. FL0043]
MSSWVITNSEADPPRACDRCHAIKERCEWVANQSQCERCLRLKHVCETVRPKGRAGRKPGVQGKQLLLGVHSTRKNRSGRIHDQRTLSVWTDFQKIHRRGDLATIPKYVPDFELGHVPESDQRLIRHFLFDDRLFNMFSVGSSFGEQARGQIIPHLLSSKPTFLDGLLACAMSWTGAIGHDQANPRRLTACYRYASSAIAILTSLEVSDFQTMVDCLMLGALVSTFAVKLRLPDILAICSRTLGLIEPIYVVSNPARAEFRGFLCCVITWELRACLFSCKMPTLRFRPPLEAYADRHAGLSATLLPLLYDICKLSHMIALDETRHTDILEELGVVEKSVRLWQPRVPEDLATRFDTIEVAHMLCHAQVMQKAALLVIHRLRCPFGVNDGPAQVLSMSILSQIEMTSTVTKQPVRGIDIALMAACIELKGSERRRWHSNIPKFSGYSPEFGQHVQNVLSSYWVLIDTFDKISWNSLVSSGAPFLRNST